MGVNGQIPTVIIETDSEDVLTNKGKIISAKYNRFSGSNV